jgi:DNA gyrase subunit A
VLSVSARGFGKRTPIADYRKQSRGGLGIISLKVSDKTGEVISAKHVTAGDGLILITQAGMIIRLSVADVRLVGRSTQGVKLIDLDPEDRVVAVAKLDEPAPSEVEPDTDPGGGGGPSGPEDFPADLAPDVPDAVN